MNTTPAAPAPITHRIADKAPEFPCWVWDSRKWIYERLRTFPTDTHWCSGIPAERPTHAPESQAQGPSELEIVDAAFAVAVFSKTHEWPAMASPEFFEFAELLDKLATAIQRRHPDFNRNVAKAMKGGAR